MSRITKSSSFIPGEQADGSVIDKNGILMTVETRLEILRSTASLPASQENIRDEISYLIKNGHDIVVDGRTGSGKTTTIPTIAREITGNKVVVTGPRVLSVIAAASRTSQMLLAQTGDPKYTLGYDEVGYRTGAGNSSDRTAGLSFHTDGTEMMRQLFSSVFPDKGVLIFDEVQEKSIPTDVLLYLARYKKDIQVIIMSATLNPQIYQDFLKARGKEIPVIEIPGKIFPIEEHYQRREGFLEKTVELAQSGKHTLLFVSGKAEIKECCEKLRTKLGIGYEVLELHAELSENEQFSVIIPPSDPHIIRVIVATNVAESSITIPYLNAVVDTGLHKIGRMNSDGISELRIEPVTQANTLQRKGRSGRVQAGVYHRHCDTLLSDLHEYPEADIENSSLEHTILLFSKSGKDLRSLVSEARRNGDDLFMHKVDSNLLNIGYERLTRIGAVNEDGNITDLGKDLLHISLDPYHARMILEGIKRGCAEETILIATILSVNGFLSKEGTWKEIKTGTNKKSDFLTYIDLYNIAINKNLSQEQIERLIYLGLNREEVLEYQKAKGEKMLFEIVVLEPLGIKNHKISQIYNKSSLIKKRIASSNIVLPKKIAPTSKTILAGDILDDILTSISAGYPFFVFSYNENTKKLEHDDKGGRRSSEDFQIANISSVKPSPAKKYIGVPFIIGPNSFGDNGISLEDDDIYFEKSESSDAGDFCILSHISEVDDSHLKNAFATQNHYTALFETKSRKEKPEEQKFLNMKQIRDEYLHIREEMGDKYSTEEYLTYLLPLLLMSENALFKRFLMGKQGPIVHMMKQRLSKFLKNNKEKYLYRISNDIDKTEKSFIHDADIMKEFRSWEQTLKNGQKKEISRGKHIPKAEIEEIQRKKDIFDSRSAYEQVLGIFEGGNFDRDFSEKETQLLHSLTESLLLSGNTFNRMKLIYETEIWTMDQMTRSGYATETKNASNQKSQLSYSSTRIRTINTFLSQLQTLVEYCNTPNKNNFSKIDFQYFITIFTNHTNKQDIPTKSQLRKYYTGLKAIQSHYNDPLALKRNENRMASAKTFFTALVLVYEDKLKKLISDQATKKETIAETRKGNLQTREELCIFFSYLYEDEYYLTIIEPKINDILRRILSSQGDNFDEIIFKYIVDELSSEELKHNKRTQKLHIFFKKRKEYHELLSSSQKKIPQAEEKEYFSAAEFRELSEFLKEKTERLLQDKSNILSL